MNKNKEISMCTKCDENLPFPNTRDYDHKNFNKDFLASEDMKMFFRGLNDHNKQNNGEDPPYILWFL